MTTQTYRDAGYELLAQAHAELDAGDVRRFYPRAWECAKLLGQAAGLPRQFRAAWVAQRHGDIP